MREPAFFLAGKRGSRRHSTASFSRNVVVAETSSQRFITSRPGKGSTSFNKNNRAIFSGEKSTMTLSGVYVFEITRKKL